MQIKDFLSKDTLAKLNYKSNEPVEHPSDDFKKKMVEKKRKKNQWEAEERRKKRILSSSGTNSTTRGLHSCFSANNDKAHAAAIRENNARFSSSVVREGPTKSIRQSRIVYIASGGANKRY